MAPDMIGEEGDRHLSKNVLHDESQLQSIVSWSHSQSVLFADGLAPLLQSVPSNLSLSDVLT